MDGQTSSLTGPGASCGAHILSVLCSAAMCGRLRRTVCLCGALATLLWAHACSGETRDLPRNLLEASTTPPAPLPQGTDCKVVRVKERKAPSSNHLAITEGSFASIDPALVHETAGNMVASQMFEGLLLAGHGNLKTRYGHADSYTISEDGKIYTFHLREGLEWSDGTPITTDDFVWSWRRALEPTTAAQAAFLFQDIKGAMAFHSSKGTWDDVGIRADRETGTLTVELAHPAPYFLSLVSEVNFALAPRHVIEAHGDKWLKPKNIVVNGPYIMVVHRNHDRVVMKRNESYWDRKAVRIEKLSFFETESETTAYQWYKTGLVQIATPIPNETVTKLRSQCRQDLILTPNLCTYYLTFNTGNYGGKVNLNRASRKTLLAKIKGLSEGQADAIIAYRAENTFSAPGELKNVPGIDGGFVSKVRHQLMVKDRPQPFQNAKIRKAVDLAIDKEALIAQVLGGDRIAATHLVHEGFADEGFSFAPGSPFDPEKARALLASAGYPGGKGFPTVELVYNTYETHKVIAEYVQRQLKENLGIRITIGNMEWKSLLDKMYNHEFYISRSSWCVDYPDPLSFLEVFTSGHENNYGSYENPEYDRLVKQAREETDPAVRNQLLVRTEEIFNRDQPVIPVYFYTHIYLKHPALKGYLPHVMDRHLLRDSYYESFAQDR